ncbi:MAG: VCBS repeat-containing protein [Microcoleus sp. PH2017_01_SCD_O_A]|uniref:FG-GAP repeat domain-containing protein n=1 Tax=unclassified Microcoleus TaxID=2642155 RepID=UPI001DF28BEF|nr:MULTISPECIES: VCBS repeat-containing protein [unclassified Microcoleus]MCC3431583.1 VCBS repeat-containing protein [Microcoleus sp. PH2017_04_SCI_O_A]MCC3426058.1 VCBS repeat-containing protein [Microcoleus sp. PH2017_01_SCD_O_A]MCC3524374.1 VCBS repeat-containing protein [Microcoleus sp. PH2017_20_SFW_D_A]MCC3555117.1 VCBS repeat-containing protein [Microcoleus sp. PH2017_35_SFW_U_B]MCC3565388.1 VCBS repeat-containing protein [Microcoleus sp. PH2017_31_RDM_U_A]
MASPFKVTEFDSGRYITNVTAGKFNGDSTTDLATMDLLSTQIGILPGDGTGKFSIGSYSSTGEFPYDFSSADFNGDGKTDLFATTVLTKIRFCGETAKAALLLTPTLRWEYHLISSIRSTSTVTAKSI